MNEAGDWQRDDADGPTVRDDIPARWTLECVVRVDKVTCTVALRVGATLRGQVLEYPPGDWVDSVGRRNELSEGLGWLKPA